MSSRDSARSRRALLDAAAVLFAERGYAGTSLRSVAEQAGVDAALVARYFGHKEGLFRAVIAADILVPAVDDAEQPAVPPAPFGSAEHLHYVLQQWAAKGPSAVVRSIFRTDADAAALLAVRSRYESILEPRARAAASGDRSDLRADLAAVLLLGVGVVRAAGTVPTLAAASEAEVEDLLGPVLASILDG